MSLSTSRPIRAPRNRDIARAFTAAFVRSTALRRLLVLAFFIAAAVSAHQLGAQEVGTISGRIVDTSGDPLSDVSIRIDGTPLGGATGLDGRYTIVHVPAGAVSLHARRIGFASKTITNIEVQAGSSAQQDIVLVPVAVTLAAQVVTASGERGSVASALDRQRTATGLVNAITAEQIARSPDANAAQAVQRVSGVTIQDGGYNSRTTGRTNIAVPTAASELLGFASRARDLPGNVRIAGDNFGALSRAQLNQVTRSFRPTWQPVERRALPNGGTSLSIGGRTPVAGQPVGSWSLVRTDSTKTTVMMSSGRSSCQTATRPHLPAPRRRTTASPASTRGAPCSGAASSTPAPCLRPRGLVNRRLEDTTEVFSGSGGCARAVGAPSCHPIFAVVVLW